jgi:hypothetical protein
MGVGFLEQYDLGMFPQSAWSTPSINFTRWVILSLGTSEDYRWKLEPEVSTSCKLLIGNPKWPTYLCAIPIRVHAKSLFFKGIRLYCAKFSMTWAAFKLVVGIYYCKQKNFASAWIPL